MGRIFYRTRMKTGEIVKSELARHKPILERRFHVSHIGVFGSVARGEAKKGSDVDVLVDFNQPIGWDFIDLKEYIEDILGRRVDLVTVNALKPQLRKTILGEVVYV